MGRDEAGHEVTLVAGHSSIVCQHALDCVPSFVINFTAFGETIYCGNSERK